MITISLCMIVKNEEDTIGNCLESVKGIADEIIIIDTGSTDDTKGVCSPYTTNIFDFTWIDDFAAARNYSFSKATTDYVLWMDADDVLLEPDRAKLLRLKETIDASVDTVFMKYNVGFDSSGNVTLSYYRERMVRRQLGCKWHEPVHEYLDCIGKAEFTDICITHKKQHSTPSGRNLRIYEREIAEKGDLSPRGQYYFARELYHNARYTDAISWFSKFLNGRRGWIEDNIAACNMMSLCYCAIGDTDGAMQAILKSLEYDVPRAENCCQIARLFFDKKEYEKAIYWYKSAMTLPKDERGLGFIQHDSYGYLPCIQLCVCYDRLGKTDEAIRYNELAARFKPDEPAIDYNRRYFQELKNLSR